MIKKIIISACVVVWTVTTNSAKESIKKINLDTIGDITINASCFCPKKAYKKLIFTSEQAHKVIIPTGTIFEIGNWATETLSFCGQAVLVVEAGASLNFTGQTLCMTGSSQIIFTPPVQ